MTYTSTARAGPGEPRQERGPAPSYVVLNSWQHARQRLELLEACYDAASVKRASGLGVREGWRCLDAGAGHGLFARWLSTQVGAAGSVVAADLDTRLLADITEPNIEVRQTDLVSDPLPAGSSTRPHPPGADAHPRPANRCSAGGAAAGVSR
jgi:hypothetical protein